MVQAALVSLFVFAGADAGFDSFFEEFARKRDGIETLRASFSQETTVPEDTLHDQGTIIYKKPKRVVFRYEPPQPTYLIDADRAYEYSPDIQQIQIYALEDNPQTEIFFLGFDDDTERLREGYDVELVKPDNEPEGAGAIEVRPNKDDEDTALFEQATLYLRPGDYLPYRIHIVNDKDSSVIIRVTDFELNEPLEPEDARIHLPEGTTVIVDDQLVERVPEGGKWVPPTDLDPEPEQQKDKP